MTFNAPCGSAGFFTFKREYLPKFSENWAFALLSWVCWLGIILATFFTIPPEESKTNQFLMISLYLSALFTALFVEYLRAGKWQRLITGTVILLTILTSFTVLARLPHDSLPRSVTKTAVFLQENTPLEAVIAAPQGNPLYGLIMPLSARRTMYLKNFKVENLIGINNAEQLAEDNRLLYQLEDPIQLKEIIRRYQVSYIIEDEKHKTKLSDNYLKKVFRYEGITIKKLTGI